METRIPMRKTASQGDFCDPGDSHQGWGNLEGGMRAGARGAQGGEDVERPTAEPRWCLVENSAIL